MCVFPDTTSCCLQQVIMDYQRALGKVALEKQLLTEKTMRNFPHDPDHPGLLPQMMSSWSRLFKISCANKLFIVWYQCGPSSVLVVYE